MKVTIDGIEYESADTQIIEGMDVSCRDCDIYKAKIPKSPIEYPLCFEPGRGGSTARHSCYAMAVRGYKRIFKKIKI